MLLFYKRGNKHGDCDTLTSSLTKIRSMAHVKDSDD